MYSNTMINVGVVGASGFTGAELLRICTGHPSFDVVVATAESHSGTDLGNLYPNLASAYPGLTFSSIDLKELKDCDLVFLGLPHGASQEIVPELLDSVELVVDLGADFRLKNSDLYLTWYGESHKAPDLLTEAAYGLPELFSSSFEGSRLIANPGCYPTAAVLALFPFLQTSKVKSQGLIIDAASGASGAGRTLKETTAFCSVDENFSAYGLLNHRDTPEIEQALSSSSDDASNGEVSVVFTPHLAPMNRGILATCYAWPIVEFDTDGALEILSSAYKDSPFVVVDERVPSTKATLGSNTAHLTARVDPRTGYLITICAIDNLGKGASGQAVQCANLLLGLEETSGLSKAGIYP